MSNPRLSSSARVALFLLTRTRKRDGYSYLSSTRLAEMLGIESATVSLLARELSDANLVRRESCGRGKGNGRRWLLLAGALAALYTPQPAQADTRALFAEQSKLHFTGNKRRRRNGASAEQTAPLIAS